MKSFVLVVLLAGLVQGLHRGPHRKWPSLHFHGDAGPLLHVTPYLKEGKADLARTLSLVTGLTPNLTSYSGYFTVDEKCDSHLFFWFFPSQDNWLADPVALWLNGGPGSSSMFGLFNENGPYALSLEGELLLNLETSWNKNASMIYIDNPVGTGYSYTGGDCYATNQEQVGREMKTALEQFFELFPELAENPFYLSGESYAGKFIPAIGHAIMNSEPPSPINLQGFAIGNGLVDPVNQQLHGDVMQQLGLIDAATRDRIVLREVRIKELLAEEKYLDALDERQSIFSDFTEASGYSYYYHYLYETKPSLPKIGPFMSSEKSRKALHVGNATWNNGNKVVDALAEDIMKSVRPWLEELLDKYRVMLFFGQMDLRDGYTAAQPYLQKLEWSGAEEYHNATRHIWRVEDRIAGYYKVAKKFVEVLVRNTGHMVPTHQPEWAQDLFNKFLFNDFN